MVTLILLVVTGGSTALAQVDTAFAVTLEDLVPGEPQTQVGTIQLDRQARLRGLEWISRTGILEDARIEVEVCPPSGPCVDADNPDATQFPAGSLAVRVTALLDSDAEAGGSGSAVGQLIFYDENDDPDLPFTGVDLIETMVWGAALVSLGVLIVAAARRRRVEEIS